VKDIAVGREIGVQRLYSVGKALDRWPETVSSRFQEQSGIFTRQAIRFRFSKLHRAMIAVGEHVQTRAGVFRRNGEDIEVEFLILLRGSNSSQPATICGGNRRWFGNRRPRKLIQVSEPVEKTKHIKFKICMFGQSVLGTSDKFRIAKIQTDSPEFLKTRIKSHTCDITHGVKQVDHVINELRQPLGP
jgi:hypothetical protein